MVNKYTICAVPINLLSVVWEQVKPIIDDVVKYSHGEATTEACKDHLFAGNLLLIVVCSGKDVVACSVVEKRTFDTGMTALSIPIFGGKYMDEWRDDMLNVLHAIAKDLGCTQLRGIGARNGWVRYLKSHGWNELNVTIGCEVK